MTGRAKLRVFPAAKGFAVAAYQQLFYHIVFSVKDRRPLLREADFRGRVWAYMAGIAGRLNMRAVRVGGDFDHAHLLVQIPAKMAVSDAVRLLKANTSRLINEERLSPYRFSWQDGYGAFTVSRSSVELVVAYIDRQLEHHRERSFQEEFLKMLPDHGVECDAKYFWE